MLKEYPADLHIHTCLSPCAQDEMNPVNILNMAKLMGTSIIGICDHNSAKNIKAMLEAAKDYDIFVLPGMEVESIEEVHILCFFESLHDILQWQDFVYDHLPSRKNNPDIFGRQQIVDKDGNVITEEEQMLLASTVLTVEEISTKVSETGGFIIPAHIDKKSFSLLGQLGFIPERLNLAAIEISRNITENEFKNKYNILGDYTIITSSDAHRLKEMVFQKTFFYLESLNFNEINLALSRKEGRKVIIRN
jgi:PHP family Zn ribbon phosphoesterase